MRQHTKTRFNPVRLGVLAGLSVFLLASSASAQTWNFCQPGKETTIEAATPQAMMMLDRSGSMAPRNNNLWGLAKNSLIAVVTDLTAGDFEKVHFGLGYFGAPPHSPYSETRGLNASIVFEAKPNALGDFMTSLGNTEPAGATPTGDAIKRISISDTLTRPASAGILITDGTPQMVNTHASIALHKEIALAEACAMRGAGQNLYVVGLGGATDTAFNNKLAAAAGQGCCGDAADATCSQGIGTDPCVVGDVGEESCFGSYEAYNQTEFSNVLLSIANDISCTFQLDTNNHPNNQAPDDPEAVNVRMVGVEGDVAVPHRSQNTSYPDEGWFFSNENRNSVTFTGRYCAMVQNGDAEVVITQVSCPCVEPPGEECAVPGPVPSGVCPDGMWTCKNGFDRCEPKPVEACTACEVYEIGALCHVDEGPYRIGEEPAMDPLAERNRCLIGMIECNDFVPACTQLYNPMPELCDGLDNDCDGKIDNITESWAKEEFEGLVIEREHANASAACFIRDACVCDLTQVSSHNGPMMTPASLEAEFAVYLSDWAPTHCECRSGLER